MNLLISLIAVIALFLCASVGAGSLGLYGVFGIALPYVAIALFLLGAVWRVVSWAKSPVPFNISTTCGQQKSLHWIEPRNLENPYNKWGVLGRMLLEVLFFRSLFRNVSMDFRKDQKKVVFGPTKWLWAGALVFHWSFLVIVLRHLRFFAQPVPGFVEALQSVDGFFQVGVPVVYVSTVAFLTAVTYLFVRRVVIPQVRFISLPSDYFPLFLLLGIGLTGLTMRHFIKADVTAVKELAIGLVTFSPVAPEVHYLFYAHLFLVSVLFAYFPFSKLMHLGGVFLSPTRNMTANSREVRHINPWNYPVPVHTYEEWEDEFRDKMVEAGIPVDKKPGEEKQESKKSGSAA